MEYPWLDFKVHTRGGGINRYTAGIDREIQDGAS
jgi:hypothetical protein